MSEDGKYRFRLTQQLIDKLIMVIDLSLKKWNNLIFFQEEILDFITILSPKSNRNFSDEFDEENKKKKFERVNSGTPSHIDDSGKSNRTNSIYLFEIFI
jgi:hypothetical protein